MRFAFVVHKEEGSSYGVTVPDLPGCFAGANTLEDCYFDAHEAILQHLGGIMDYGEPLPNTTPLEELVSDEQYRDGTWVLIEVDETKVPGKAVRINITVPSRLLDSIDNSAKKAGLNRSRFLVKAALEHIRSNPSK